MSWAWLGELKIIDEMLILNIGPMNDFIKKHWPDKKRMEVKDPPTAPTDRIIDKYQSLDHIQDMLAKSLIFDYLVRNSLDWIATEFQKTSEGKAMSIHMLKNVFREMQVDLNLSIVSYFSHEIELL